jgi:hypothetical protein
MAHPNSFANLSNAILAAPVSPTSPLPPISPVLKTGKDCGWHLTEPLCKPLHHFNEGELAGLIKELQDTGYERREEMIQEAVESIVQMWRGEQAQPSYASAHNFQYAMPRTATGYASVHVTLPPWVPFEYVRTLAERMIRDQLEEVGP